MGQEEEFVIRMADGTYYAGGTVGEGNLLRTADPERAARYPSRWMAVTVAAQGISFAQACIVGLAEARRLAEVREARIEGMQGRQSP